MNFFKVILLVCATSVPRGECQIDTAMDIITGPDARNEVTCGMMSQAYVATTTLGRRLTDDEYLKILCRRSGPIPNHASADSTTTLATIDPID